MCNLVEKVHGRSIRVSVRDFQAQDAGGQFLESR
jgi:hypothetical protein